MSESDSTFQHTVKLPPGMRTVRRQTPKVVEIPVGHMPLIDPAGPDNQQIQEILKARTRQFDMSKPEDALALEDVWQRVSDGHAAISESVTSFVPQEGRYVVFVRWGELSYVAPRQPGT